MANWKIYISCGTTEEFETLKSLTFPNKQSAKEACKNGIAMPSGKTYHYPQRCIVREETWNEWKTEQ